MNKAIAFKNKAEEVYKLLNEMAQMYDADLVSWANQKLDDENAFEDDAFWAASRVINFSDDLHAYSRDEFSVDCE
jgi:hypothetical protein